MTKTESHPVLRALLMVAAAAVLLAAPDARAFARRTPQPSFDMVPRASWTYDALTWLAAKGRMQPYTAHDFRSSRTFTRVEIADLIRDLKVVNGHTWDGYTATEKEIVLQLATEYRPELEFLDVNLEDYLDGLEAALPEALLANVWAEADVSRTGSETRTIGTQGANLLGMEGSDTAITLSVTNEHNALQPGNHAPFPLVDRFSVQHHDKDWRWELGRAYSWFGTSSAGSMWLQDSSPAPLLGRVDGSVDFGRMLGAWRLSAQIGGFNDGGENYYLISRRLQKTVSRQWGLGFLDMVKTTETPNPMMLLLPGPAYQSVFLEQIDTKWNSMLGFEAIYHPASRWEAYAQWMIDDMSNPFDPADVPKKTGILVGFRTRSGEPMDAGTRLQVNYAVIEPGVYEATRPEYPYLAWTRQGLPLAWPFGPNSRTLTVRTERKIAERVDLVTSYVERRVKVGEGKFTSWSIQPTWDFRPNQSLGLFLQRNTGTDAQNVVGIQASVVF